jgi:ParB family chromosome partitioning protein
VPAIVREMTDDQVLEAQLEENIHRKDLTPLEEAAGYRRLIASNPTKHSAESIATRIGMSVGYVWDRLKLNDLIPEAKAILEQGQDHRRPRDSDAV